MDLWSVACYGSIIDYRKDPAMGKTFSQCSKAKRALLQKRNKARRDKHVRMSVFTDRKDK